MGSDPQSHLQAIYDLEHEACKKTEADLHRQLAEAYEASKALAGCANEWARQTHALEDLLAEAQASLTHATSQIDEEQAIAVDLQSKLDRAQARSERLEAALRAVAPDVCSYLCPSVKPIDQIEWTHCEKCTQVSKALAAQPAPAAITDMQHLGLDYVAWLRWAGDSQHRHLVICDSDAPRAFKVWRRAVAPDAAMAQPAPKEDEQ